MLLRKLSDSACVDIDNCSVLSVHVNLQFMTMFMTLSRMMYTAL